MDRKQAVRELVSFRDNGYEDLNNGLTVQELHRNYAASFDKAIKVVESIESDIKKPVIPGYMDSFIDDNLRELEGVFTAEDSKAELILITNREINAYIENYVPDKLEGITEEVAMWYCNNKIDYVNAVMHGYTVEKEKTWYVKDAVTKQLLKRTPDGFLWMNVFLDQPDKFTEKEIKNIDSSLWDKRVDPESKIPNEEERTFI